MGQFLMYLLLALGFILLIKGADYFVDGTSTIAKKLHISPLVIGLTIVAFGTSAPEAAVSITALIKGSTDMAVGNIIGSNIFNMLVVVGASALFLPIVIDKSVLKMDFPFNILITAIFFILISDIWFFGARQATISLIDGLILIALFVAFITYILVDALKNKGINEDHDDIRGCSVWQSLWFTLVGLAGILLGGYLAVNNAQKIALSLGISETLVGLAVVSIATSLPELVTSIVAAKKKQSDIAMGNVIGSCIFNMLFILGISSLITPIAVDYRAVIDTVTLLGVTVVVYLFAQSRKTIGRLEGGILLSMYIAYLTYVIIRN